MAEPTIIIGSLNDAELKQSIDKLVEHVNSATKTMVTDFNSAIAEMERTLRNFGNTNINSGSTSDGGSSRRTAAQNKEKQAVQENTLSYDQQAQTIHKVVSEQQSYSSEIRKAADAIRQSASWQENGIASVGRAVVYKKEEISVEEQLLQLQKKYGDEVLQTSKNIDNQAASVRQFGGEVKVANDNAINMHQQTMRSREIMAQGSMQSVTQSYDQLSQTIMRTLGISRDELVVIENEQYSYNALAAQLRQMNQAYAELTTTERSSDSGRELAQNIQTASRELQKMQNEKMRPQSLQQAMGLDEHTLDDISYKIKQLQLYQNGLNITTTDGIQEYKMAGAAIDDLKKRQDKLMGSQKGLIQGNNALTRSFNYMKNRLAFMFTVGGTTAFVKQLAEVRGEYEMTERALGVLVDSAQRGTQIFQELSQMALVSPYTLIELSKAAKQLVAYDVAAKDVVDTTRRLADISAAVGAPVERLTYALGQIKAYEYLNSRDARIFANAGIPLVKQLSQYYSELEGRMISVGDVYDRIKKKAVSYNDVMSVLTRMTDEGGRFFDYQAKVADTLKVQLANLTLAWNNMLNDIGKRESGLLTGSVKALKQVFLQWKSINSILTRLIATYGILKGIQIIYTWSIKDENAAKMKSLILNEKLRESYKDLRDSISKNVWSAKGWISALLLIAISAVQKVREINREIHELNRTIADNAKEASARLKEFTSGNDNIPIFEKAKKGLLTADEASKAWDMVREEIENSSAAASVFIPKLMEIEDLNERVTAAFNLANRIQDAIDNLDKLYDEIDITQDFDEWIMGKKGLVDNLTDYQKWLKAKEKAEQTSADNTISIWKKAMAELRFLWLNGFIAGGDPNNPLVLGRNFGQSGEIAKEQVKDLVKQISDYVRATMGDAAAKDSTIVAEFAYRIIQGIEQSNPEIAGAVKDSFEENVFQAMSEEFGGAFNKGLLAQKKFFDLLKRNFRHEFDNLTDDDSIIANGGLTPAQQAAISSAAESLGTEWKSILWQSFNDAGGNFDAKKFEHALLATFDVVDRNAIQREFDKVFLFDKESDLYGTYRNERIGDSEDTLAWEKRLADEEGNLKDKVEQVNEMLEKRGTLKDDTIAQLESEKEKYNLQLKAIKDTQEHFGLRNKQQLDDDKKHGKAQDDLNDALRKEVQLITDIQRRYEEYRSMGMSATEAMNTAAVEYGASLSRVNGILRQFGLQTLSVGQLSNMTSEQIRDFFNAQLATATMLGRELPQGIEALEKAIAALNVELAKTDFNKKMNSFKTAIEDIKDSYEFAKEIKENPSLGNIFADMMGLSDDDIKKLPQNANGVMMQIQRAYEDAFGESDFNIADLLKVSDLKRFFDENGIKLDSELAEEMTKAVNIINDIRLKEAQAQIDDWNKLLEKYAEYEYKRTEIIKQAERERETARKNHASQDIFNAIDKKERQQLAGLDFEQFQKSNMWLTATGDLATLTDGALRGLIDTLDEYKDKAKDLDPKDIKSINSALRKMHKELRKGNPFTAIAEAIQDAKDRAEDFGVEIAETEAEFNQLFIKFESGFATEEEIERMGRLGERLGQLKRLATEVSKVSPTAVVSGINDAIGVARTATDEFKELADAIGGDAMTQATENLEHTMNIIESAGQGAAIGAQLGGGWGALIGAVAGGLKGAVVEFMDEWTGNAGITREIQRVQRGLTHLGQTYDELAWQADNAYGACVVGAKDAAKANKELQLAETKRQLQLERSRKAKNQDADEIQRLEGEVAGLRREVNDMAENVINDLLGISSAGAGIEGLVQVMIDAFKEGEDAMVSFGDKWDEMIDNMILKLIVSKVMEKEWDSILAEAQQIEDAATKAAAAKKQELENMTEKEWKDMYTMEKNTETYKYGMWVDNNWQYTKRGNREWEKNGEKYKQQVLAEADEALHLASIKAVEDVITYMSTTGRERMYGKLDETLETISQYWNFGEDSDKQLSLLQQGIQGITEETAGALEAYMNGVSQQVYLHSSILGQIRDAIVTPESGIEEQLDLMRQAAGLSEDEAVKSDLQMGVMSQMLLQLQASYQMQGAIYSILNGWSNADGQSVRVTMIS